MKEVIFITILGLILLVVIIYNYISISKMSDKEIDDFYDLLNNQDKYE